ncbi:MAG: EhaD family protein [Methanobrevibacter sp.]|jgi:energy-converting hydrogenase A subunit D|nr:EhaD family protein [Candidatus Methanovirga aequatorialis]
MNILDFITLTNVSIVLMIIGALGIMFLVEPLDKIIMLSLLEGGLFGAVVSFKYLDVAFIMAILNPVSIFVFLLALIKVSEIRNKKEDEDDGHV